MPATERRGSPAGMQDFANAMRRSPGNVRKPAGASENRGGGAFFGSDGGCRGAADPGIRKPFGMEDCHYFAEPLLNRSVYIIRSH